MAGSMIDRRRFLELAGGASLAVRLASAPNARAEPADAVDSPRPSPKSFLTKADAFIDVSRGKPVPHSLRGEALAKARLTPETWRLEIVGDNSAEVANSLRIEDNSALDLNALKELGKTRGVAFLKSMQCNNIPSPLGQGLWEGVPLRDVLALVGKVGNIRRVYYWGFHNDDPAQMFQSSLAYNRVLETPPWEPPPLVAYRLNGEDIPLKRGGPVRMLIPWAHGFKSIKWLQRIVLTNDYQANDTYALQNNDPESYLKTAAYLGTAPEKLQAGKSLELEGTAMVGWSGLERVESWIRPATGGDPKLPLDDPAWKSAVWTPCELMPPPDDWSSLLPAGVSPRSLWGFDSKTGKPKDWPLLFSTVWWSARIEGLAAGTYEFRVRAVDRNGFAQPEPRPYQKSGMNLVPCQILTVA
jgi:DMSO/TMAO reductase YedYZ molybdopterin-dependent catalytic subunit